MSITVALVILLLIAINALYVAAEFSAVIVRPARLEQLAEEGDRLAARLVPQLADPVKVDRYVAACQIGITISSLLLGAYGQAALAPALAPLLGGLGLGAVSARSAAATAVLVLLTVLQMVLGELVPKSLALQYPTGTARLTTLPMQLSLRLLAWFIWLLNGSGALVLRLLGFRQAGHHHLHSPEELELLFAESRQGGLLDPTGHRRLRQAFRLATRRVSDVMVPRVRVIGLDVETPFAEAAQRIGSSPYTRLPLYEGSLDRIVGFLHVRDVAWQTLGGAPVALRELARPVVAVPEASSALSVLRRLREARQHLALVVDEFGGTAGVVTVGDLLAEIFGGTVDEHPGGEAPPERLEDGRLRLPAALRLDRVQAWVGERWEGESHTVGGLVMERLGRIPAPGERLRIGAVELEVERMEGPAIATLLATLPPPARSPEPPAAATDEAGGRPADPTPPDAAAPAPPAADSPGGEGPRG